jgi:hypothetical protein
MRTVGPEKGRNLPAPARTVMHRRETVFRNPGLPRDGEGTSCHRNGEPDDPPTGPFHQSCGYFLMKSMISWTVLKARAVQVSAAP